jgi:segregation and condensation protein A
MEGPIYHLEDVLRDKQEAGGTFIGPLDLILHLLSKNKIEIRDIPVAKILDQYMEWVSRLQEQNLEIASEFIAMAAHLLYLKTRMLLSAQDEEALSEMEQLMASLEERQRGEAYQRIKLVLGEMDACYQRGSAYIAKAPEPLPSGRRFDYRHAPEELKAAMEQVSARSRRRLPPPVSAFQGVVGREPYPVEKKVEEIMDRLKVCRRLSLGLLWRESQSRSEVVAVFVAVLELCRTGQFYLAEAAEEAVLCLAEDRGLA